MVNGSQVKTLVVELRQILSLLQTLLYVKLIALIAVNKITIWYRH